MDFNVGKMAAIVHVLRNGEPRAVRELMKVYDTPAMIKRIRKSSGATGRRYVASRQIYIYPDASGDSRKSIMPAPRISRSLSRPDSAWW
jgi:hypothetical protein